MNGGIETYRVAGSGRASLIGWWCWVAAVVAVSVPAFIWHLEYAQQGHSDIFPLFAAAVVAIPFAVAPVYQLIRRRGLWSWEPVVFLGVILAAGLVYSPVGTLFGGSLFLGAYCTGQLALNRLKLEAGGEVQDLVFSFLTGFSMLVWPLALLGHLGQYNRISISILLVAAVAVSYRSAGRLALQIKLLARRWGESEEVRAAPVGFAVVLLAVLAAAGLAVALAPSISFDPLRFHLPLARHYAETGGLSPLESDGYGYNPQNFEMLLAAAYTMWGQAAAQLVPPGFFALFLAALYALCRRVGFGRGAAVVGAVFAISLPYVHWTGVNVKHDVIVALLQVGALLAWFEWRRCRNFRWIYLGVFFCATAMGFKHPAAFGILGLAPLFVWAAWLEPRRLRAFAICGAAFLLVGSFWQVRSYVLTGDPFFYYNFEQPLPDEHAGQVGSVGDRLRTAATWPVQIHTDGRLFFRSFTPNPVGFGLLLFAPVWALLRRKEGTGEGTALLFALLALAPWSLYVPLLRFVIAPICVLMALTAGRLHSWHQKAGPALRWPIRTAAGWCAAFSICVILIIEVNGPQFRYFLSHRDRERYLSEALLTYKSLDALKTLAAPGDYIAGVDNCSMAYSPDPDIFFCQERDPESEADAADLGKTLNDKRFRFVVLPVGAKWDEFLRKSAGRRPAKRVFEGENYSIYELE